MSSGVVNGVVILSHAALQSARLWENNVEDVITIVRGNIGLKILYFERFNDNFHVELMSVNVYCFSVGHE